MKMKAKFKPLFFLSILIVSLNANAFFWNNNSETSEDEKSCISFDNLPSTQLKPSGADIIKNKDGKVVFVIPYVETTNGKYNLLGGLYNAQSYRSTIKGFCNLISMDLWSANINRSLGEGSELAANLSDSGEIVSTGSPAGGAVARDGLIDSITCYHAEKDIEPN